MNKKREMTKNRKPGTVKVIIHNCGVLKDIPRRGMTTIKSCELYSVQEEECLDWFKDIENKINARYSSGYWVVPGNYILTTKKIQGHEHKCSVAEIIVRHNGNWSVLRKLDKVPDFVQTPCDCLQNLART